jgi:hypothetical protein
LKVESLESALIWALPWESQGTHPQGKPYFDVPALAEKWRRLRKARQPLLVALTELAKLDVNARTEVLCAMIEHARLIRARQASLLPSDSTARIQSLADECYKTRHRWLEQASGMARIQNLTLRQVLIAARILHAQKNGKSAVQVLIGEEFGLTESDISRIFKLVEKNIGVKLRHRPNGGPRVGITAAGEALYPALYEVAQAAALFAGVPVEDEEMAHFEDS